MKAPRIRRFTTTVLVAAVGAAVLPVAAPPVAIGQEAETVSGVPVVQPELARFAMHADGTRVRTDGDVTVDVVDLHGRFAGVLGSRDLYRVRIRGHYLPRAQRYVVRAGGDAVAWGIPGPALSSLVAITTNASVLSEPIRIRYGGRPASGEALVDQTSAEPVGTSTLGPKMPGPFEVSRTGYDFGDQVFQPAGLPARVELRADVQYPTDLSAGPFPLVLFLHGNHSACYRRDRAGFRWPCPEGWKPIPNFRGYDYLASRLASYGYIVASVSGNGVNVLGSYLDDTGMRQRGELLEKHIDLFNEWNSTGGEPFGTKFVGAVDMSRIGVMGHSRGGEGAVYNVIVDRDRPSPYGIDAVLPLAPVDFTRPTINEVPLGVMLPYCDGDVYDLQGVHFFDDSRYAVPGDASAKATVTVFGANHNFFNTVWSPSSGIPGAFDDGWNCDGRLTESRQRRVGIAYIVSFFRRYVGGETAPGSVWTGERTPASLDPGQTAVTYLAPDDAASRLDVDRFTDPGDLARTELGGAVRAHHMGIVGWCSNVYDSPCVPGRNAFDDIHLSWSWFGPAGPGLQEGILGWSSSAEGSAFVRFDLGGNRNVGAYDFLGFRTVPNPGYDANRRVAYQDLVVVLKDGTGATASVAAADIGNDVLRYPLEGRRGAGHVIMNQIRFPLEAFVGVDLSSIASVTLRFSRTERGVIDVSDLAFFAGEA